MKLELINHVILQARLLASHSWEYGALSEALLEWYNPSEAVFGPNAFPMGKIPNLIVNETQSLVYAMPHIRINSTTLVDGDGMLLTTEHQMQPLIQICQNRSGRRPGLSWCLSYLDWPNAPRVPRRGRATSRSSAHCCSTMGQRCHKPPRVKPRIVGRFHLHGATDARLLGSTNRQRHSTGCGYRAMQFVSRCPGGPYQQHRRQYCVECDRTLAPHCQHTWWELRPWHLEHWERVGGRWHEQSARHGSKLAASGQAGTSQSVEEQHQGYP